jgi:serralysin
MGYTVSLTTGAASQNEGNPGGTAASYTFTLNRDAGDAGVATNYTYTVYNASTFAVADDFAVNTAAVTGWSGPGGVGVLQTTVTITANLDTTIEANETFFVYFNIAGVNNPFAEIQNLQLVNDDAGPPVFSSSATLNSAENGTAVGTVAATGSGTVTYSFNGGADVAQFGLDSASGVLTFLASNDFEAPDDVGADRVYNVVVRATAGGQTTDQAIAVTLTNVNEAITINSNGGGATAAINVAENATAVTTVTRTDIDAGDTVTYSLNGGADSSFFQIDPATGVLTFIAGRNFESPADSGANNTYVVNVRATDSGGLTDDQEITVTITDAAEDPIITSNGGGGIAIVRVAENMATTTTVLTAQATDQDAGAGAMVYSIAGGADAADFSIVGGTGVLTFAVSPNFEAPHDANTDNLYEVIVQAANGAGVPDTQTVYIFVDNVIEPGVPTDVPTVPGTPPVPPTPPSNAGNDNISGTISNEYLAGGPGDDSINGAGGDDAIDGDAGNDYIQGGDGNDFVRGLDGDDLIDGGAGADDVNGNAGVDDVRGGDGSDTVRGGQGNDVVYGNDGDDGHVNGNIGEDIVRGGAGNDSVYGGQGNDSVYGDEGSDQLSGDLGNDLLFGGAGADRFLFRTGGGQDWVGDFSAADGDRIVLAPGQAYTVVNHGGQVVIQLGGGDQIGLAGVSFSSFSSTWIEFA